MLKKNVLKIILENCPYFVKNKHFFSEQGKRVEQLCDNFGYLKR